ncbi:hypothetical protein H072_3456 [Dactylellina haptotyla CBS 200.50]|uniref:Uncharacterized protein n=1 Tax=Dactylellina haptotyla (strain CBS 200.50) TaxID=1284197 RepID=S8AHQ0_DACHA|nr:hypothetical protein H072_3456 [Dactylellina haptotyla CBS 200.50]
MLISRTAPFSLRYLRIVAIISLLFSVASTTLITVIAACTWLDLSQLRVPFVIAAALNIISTTLMLVFSMWTYSAPMTIIAGGIPVLFFAIATAGLWGVSIIQFRWMPRTLVGGDSRWFLTIAIALWVMKLTLDVIFWTLLVALRCRRVPPRRQLTLDEPPSLESIGIRPASSYSAKPVEGRPQVRRSLLLLQNIHKNWSRPFRSSKHAHSLSFRDMSTTPPPMPPARPPRSPPRPYEYQLGLEPSPFTQSTTSLHGATSPFLNLINRPKSRGGQPTPPTTTPSMPLSPVAATFPMAIREQEASNLAVFDEWDTSQLSLRDRIAYSLAAAQAAIPNPGEPPHARIPPVLKRGAGNENVNSTGNGTVTRPQRSSSMPTPPRTPPTQIQVQRAVSTGSNQSRCPSAEEVIPPIPTSPKSTGRSTPRPIPTPSPSNLKNLGVNIPLCDSPDRENSVRLGSSPLQVSTNLRAMENRESTLTVHSKFSDTSPSRASSRSSDDAPSWHHRWAATLERKVTPPIPGFELSPRESMRRMREEREKQTKRQRKKQRRMLSGTSWIREEHSESDISVENSNGVRSRRSYVAPTTPNTGEFPRSVVQSLNEDSDGSLLVPPV